jgi:luciferase-like monooxygenase
MLLAAMAQRTRTIRLGTAVSLVPFDNPVRLAEDFGLVDVLSGGRLEFGAGRGLFGFEFTSNPLRQGVLHINDSPRRWFEGRNSIKERPGLASAFRRVRQAHS